MKKIIIFLILLSAFSIVGAQTNFEIYYKLNLDYDKGNIEIYTIEIEFSKEKIENYFGLYTVKVLDYDGEILNLTFFDVPNEILYDTVDPETGEINGGGTFILNETSFEIFIPYYKNAKEIVIQDENLNELAKKDISEYSKQRKEISEEVVKSKEKQTTDDEMKISENKTSRYLWIFLIIFIILIIVLFYSLNKK